MTNISFVEKSSIWVINKFRNKLKIEQISLSKTIVGYFIIFSGYWIIEGLIRSYYNRLIFDEYFARIAIWTSLLLYVIIAQHIYKSQFNSTLRNVVNRKNKETQTAGISNTEIIIEEYLNEFPPKWLFRLFFIISVSIFYFGQLYSILAVYGYYDYPPASKEDLMVMGVLYPIIGMIIIPYMMAILGDGFAHLISGIFLSRKLSNDTRLGIQTLSNDRFGGFRILLNLNLLASALILFGFSIFLTIGIFFYESEDYVIFQFVMIFVFLVAIFVLIYPSFYLISRVSSNKDQSNEVINTEIEVLRNKLFELLTPNLSESKTEIDTIHTALQSLEILSKRVNKTQTFPIDFTLISSIISSFGIPLMLIWIQIQLF